MDETHSQDLRLEIEELEDERVVRLFGELDLECSERVHRALLARCGEGPGAARAIPAAGGNISAETSQVAAMGLSGGTTRRVVADLSNLQFIDSSGMSALLVARRALESDGRALEIRGAGRAVRLVFEASGLQDVLDD